MPSGVQLEIIQGRSAGIIFQAQSIPISMQSRPVTRSSGGGENPAAMVRLDSKLVGHRPLAAVMIIVAATFWRPLTFGIA